MKGPVHRPKRFRCVFLTAAACLIFNASFLQAQDERIPVKIHLYGSLIGTLDRDDALPQTSPLIKRLERDLDYPIEFEIGDETDLKDLKKFGQAIVDGDIHIGIVWGLEYSWLKKQDYGSDLDVLVVCQVGELQEHYSQLMIPRSRPSEDVRGMTLAKFQGVSLAGQHYERSLENKFDLKSENFKTANDALFSVIKDKNENKCVAIDVFHLNLFRTTCPGAADRLKEAGQSESYTGTVADFVPKLN